MISLKSMDSLTILENHVLYFWHNLTLLFIFTKFLQYTLDMHHSKMIIADIQKIAFKN